MFLRLRWYVRRESAASSAGTTTPLSAVISVGAAVGELGTMPELLGIGLARPKEPRDMSEGLAPCGGGGGGLDGGTCRGDCGMLLIIFGLPNGSLVGVEPGLSGANDCWLGGSGFCPDRRGMFCVRIGFGSGFESWLMWKLLSLGLVDCPRNGGISGMFIWGRTEARLGVGIRCCGTMSKFFKSAAISR